MGWADTTAGYFFFSSKLGGKWMSAAVSHAMLGILTDLIVSDMMEVDL
jgi:hypothetical protein